MADRETLHTETYLRALHTDPLYLPAAGVSREAAEERATRRSSHHRRPALRPLGASDVNARPNAAGGDGNAKRDGRRSRRGGGASKRFGDALGGGGANVDDIQADILSLHSRLQSELDGGRSTASLPSHATINSSRSGGDGGGSGSGVRGGLPGHNASMLSSVGQLSAEDQSLLSRLTGATLAAAFTAR